MVHITKSLLIPFKKEEYQDYLLHKRDFSTAMGFILILAKLLYNILMIVDI